MDRLLVFSQVQIYNLSVYNIAQKGSKINLGIVFNINLTFPVSYSDKTDTTTPSEVWGSVGGGRKRKSPGGGMSVGAWEGSVRCYSALGASSATGASATGASAAAGAAASAFLARERRVVLAFLEEASLSMFSL